MPLTQPVTLYYPNHCYSPRRGLQTFFPSRSLSAALSSIASANSFYSRRFSSSSDFSRRASEISSPPYLAFHLMGWTAPPHRSRKWRTNSFEREVTQMKVHVLGVDLAKNVFQLHGSTERVAQH